MTGVVAAALLGAGCGPSSHPNDPPASDPAEITVNIAPTQMQVQPPTSISNRTTANLSRIEIERPEANPKADLVVHFTISNATSTNTALEISGPSLGAAKVSPEIVANGNATYQVALPTGRYR